MKTLSLLLLLCVSPCFGQTIFRATPIDMEQNERLDALEEKVAALTQTPVAATSVAPAIPKQFVRTEYGTRSTAHSYGSTGTAYAYATIQPSYASVGSANYAPTYTQRTAACANGQCSQRRGLFGLRR